jgi:hypothetical protein
MMQVLEMVMYVETKISGMQILNVVMYVMMQVLEMVMCVVMDSSKLIMYVVMHIIEMVIYGRHTLLRHTHLRDAIYVIMHSSKMVMYIIMHSSKMVIYIVMQVLLSWTEGVECDMTGWREKRLRQYYETRFVNLSCYIHVYVYIYRCDTFMRLGGYNPLLVCASYIHIYSSRTC